MIQIKKTILTLVALFAMTAGAWATDYPTGLTDGQVLHVGDTFTPETTYHLPSWSWSLGSGVAPYKLVRVNFTPAATPFDEATIEEAADGQYYAFYVSGWSSYNLPYDADEQRIVGLGEYVFEATATSDGLTVTKNDTEVSFAIHEASTPAASDVTVAWTAASKTGTFKMPGGNVELEPEYYPQATVADGGVTAADADARATTDDPLVKVDATKLTGAKKLMYFVSNSGTTAPAYDAEGWTDQLPTAEGFTQQGIVYVWYYPVGIDEGVDEATATYSDGDICLQSITARIAAAPTYAVTFADDTAEPTLWTASPNTGVTKGQTVTVTYTGSKKVLGVKAEKKAKAVTYTELKGGEVLKVGDIIDLSNTTVQYGINDGFILLSDNSPITVMRANITGDKHDPTVTEDANGDYYVLKDKNGGYYLTSGSTTIPATATSDGISVTAGYGDDTFKSFTFTVHEP